jgi:hypothetical protein
LSALLSRPQSEQTTIADSTKSGKKQIEFPASSRRNRASQVDATARGDCRADIWLIQRRFDAFVQSQSPAASTSQVGAVADRGFQCSQRDRNVSNLSQKRVRGQESPIFAGIFGSNNLVVDPRKPALAVAERLGEFQPQWDSRLMLGGIFLHFRLLVAA